MWQCVKMKHFISIRICQIRPKSIVCQSKKRNPNNIIFRNFKLLDANLGFCFYLFCHLEYEQKEVIDVTFGEKLKKRREEKGLSQDDIADFFGENFSRQAVSKWERGEGYPEVNTLLGLAAKLDISLDVLFEEELNYLKKNTPNDMMEKYPGAVAGLKVLAEYFSKL